MKEMLNINLRINIRVYPFLILTIITMINIIYQNIDLLRQHKFIMTWEKVSSNISCYYVNEGDALLSVEDPRVVPGAQSIFFHETSCRGGLDSRQACAVESAARANDNWDVYILFNSPVSQLVLNNSCIAKLLQYPNVKVARVHITDYCKGTMINRLIRHLNFFKNPIAKAADIQKIITLYKYGGICLDFDVIVLKKLEKAGLNWMVKVAEGTIATEIMALDNKYGQIISAAMLMDMEASFNPLDIPLKMYWDTDVISSTIQQLCPDSYNSTDYDCNGLKVYPQEMFMPVDRDLWYAYYDARDMDDLFTPFTHCVWNKEAKGAKIDKDSPYATLARKYCPTIYEMYGDKFGE